MVGVEKRQLQPPGELPPDGGFTGAGEADEGDHYFMTPTNKSVQRSQERTLIDPASLDSDRN
jgi:hypothetical protein